MLEKLFEGFEPSGRGADPHDRESTGRRERLLGVRHTSFESVLSGYVRELGRLRTFFGLGLPLRR